ncbi:hypothetical protein [Amycolatopsis australiensis]|uniref:Uncharacterized protein n=1 Tax=Amycolatopsis australiensis TaxID=546364 RepID=A0A1K1RSJ6_9PSEU|nr:hypothetical protein [Amycolatopsis australiensis]SFW74789.1 hypothetical protein SAMN04489730_3830 [Amycolatopsis australiensis]
MPGKNDRSVIGLYQQGTASCLSVVGRTSQRIEPETAVNHARLIDVIGALSADFRKSASGVELFLLVSDVTEWADRFNKIPLVQGGLDPQERFSDLDPAAEAERVVRCQLGQIAEGQSLAPVRNFFESTIAEISRRVGGPFNARSVVISTGVYRTTGTPARTRAVIRLEVASYQRDANKRLCGSRVRGEYFLELDKFANPRRRKEFEDYITHSDLDDIENMAKGFLRQDYLLAHH